MSAPAIVAGLKFIGAAMAAKTAIEGLKEGNLLKAVVGGVGAYFGFSNLGAAVGTQQVTTDIAQQTMTQGAELATNTASLTEKAAETFGMSGMASGTVANGAAKTALDAGLSNAASQLSGSAASNFGAGMADLGSFAAEQGLLGSANMTIPSASSFMSDGLSAATNNVLGGAATTLDNGSMYLGANAARSGTEAFHAMNNAVDGRSWLGKLKGFGGDAMQWAKDNPLLASSAMQMGGGLLQGMGQQGRFEEEMAALEASRKRRQLTGDTSFLRNTRYNPNTGRFEQVA